MSTLDTNVKSVCDLVRDRMAENSRTIIGVAGPPASGKSTLAEAVVKAFIGQVVGNVPMATLIPMDGYHLDNDLLEARGLLARKGAPETFDADGFCEGIRRLKRPAKEAFYPRFDRQMDLSIAHSISVHPDTPVVVVEGNYLLLDSQPWSSLKDVFSATVFVSPTLDVLRNRLVQRWIDHGLDPEAAKRRASQNDLHNAELVLLNSTDADLVLRQDGADKAAQSGGLASHRI